MNVSAMEIQNSGPISMKLGTVGDQDPGKVFMYVRKTYGLLLAS
jgi:hypothetical protein